MQYEKFQEIRLSTLCLQKISLYIGLRRKRTTGLAQSCPYILTTNNWITGFVYCLDATQNKKGIQQQQN